MHGQVSRLLALEDAINVPSCTPILVKVIRTIRDQATGANEVALVVDRGKVVPGSKCNNQIAMREHERAWDHDQSAVGGACECRDRVFDLRRIAHIDRSHVYAK